MKKVSAEQKSSLIKWILCYATLSILTALALTYLGSSGRYSKSIAGNIIFLLIAIQFVWFFRILRFDLLGLSKKDLGIVRPRYWLGVPLGVLMGVAFFSTALLLGGKIPKETEPKEIVILASIIIAPITEEVLDRGFIFTIAKKVLSRIYRPNSGLALAYLISAAMFTAFHYELFGSTLPAYFFAAGLMYAFLFDHTKSLLPPMAAHATLNTLVNYSALMN